MKASKTKTGTDLIKLFQNKHDTNDIDYKAISKWAIENEFFEAKPITPEEQCEQLLRKTVKNAKRIDPKGRSVRIFGIPRVFFEGEMLTLSPVDMYVAKPDIAKTVFDANFDGMGNDTKRHSIEVDSYNDNNPYNEKLPLYNYDFNHLAEEARSDGQYDDSFDEDDFNDDEE